MQPIMVKDCERCGAPLTPDMSACRYCRTAVLWESDSKHPTAGSPEPYLNYVILTSDQVKDYSSCHRIVALLLCFFFGMLGVHCFYCRKVGWGIVYFFTCGLCGAGWLFDIIRIAVGSYTDKEGLPLRI